MYYYALALVYLSSCVSCSPLDWLPSSHQLDEDTGRVFAVQNVSLVITYTGLVVAVVMMASLFWLATNYGNTHQYSQYRHKRSPDLSGLEGLTSLLDSAVRVYEEEDGEEEGVREGRQSPSLEGILVRNLGDRKQRKLSCAEYEMFCNIGTLVRRDNMEIGEALPIVYTALGRSETQDFRSSLTNFLSGLQGRDCAQKPEYCD